MKTPSHVSWSIFGDSEPSMSRRTPVRHATAGGAPSRCQKIYPRILSELSQNIPSTVTVRYQTSSVAGGRVSNSEEQDLARAMIRLYGADAESVAAGHAETHAEMGDKPKSDKWRRIASAVASLRVRSPAPN
jgi:hypothetical protein